jgi:hypothetical protein
LCGHVARCAEDSDQDGVADENSDPEGDAEDLEELAAAGPRNERLPDHGVVHAVDHHACGSCGRCYEAIIGHRAKIEYSRQTVKRPGIRLQALGGTPLVGLRAKG